MNLNELKEAVERLDDLFYKAFEAEHPAIHDYALLKIELKRLSLLEKDKVGEQSYVTDYRESITIKQFNRLAQAIYDEYEKNIPSVEKIKSKLIDSKYYDERLGGRRLNHDRLAQAIHDEYERR